MGRLFISLYLFIAVTLVGLSAVLDNVFVSSPSKYSRELTALVQLFTHSSRTTEQLQTLSKQTGLAMQILDTNSIAWQQVEKQKLLNGEVIVLFDHTLGPQLYILSSNKRLVEITVGKDNQNQPPLLFYSGLFFILLGALLAAWVWPLWRDLAKLKKAAETLGHDGTIEPIQIRSSSPIAPIANALNTMSEQVSALLFSQKELTGAVAHEFRTPLSRLKFALAVSPTPGSSPWQAMNADVNELEKLVDEMLSYTDMDCQIPELNMSEIPIRSLCQHAIDKIAEPTKGDIHFSLVGEDLRILADADYIERAVDNLLLNACRYAKSTIQVTIRSVDNKVAIHIEDDGIGIPAELFDKVFEPFFRPDEGRDRQRGGAGLGLAIVKRITQWHEGQCLVKKSVIGGAEFVIILNKMSD